MIYHNTADTIETTKLFLLCPDTIASLAEQAIVDAAAGVVDLIQEAQDDSVSKIDIEETFDTLPDIAAQYVLDTINELRIAIIAQIYNTDFTATVRGIEYTEEGDLNDIHIDIAFEE